MFKQVLYAIWTFSLEKGYNWVLSKTTIDEKAIELVDEIKERSVLVKEELKDVVDAVKGVQTKPKKKILQIKSQSRYQKLIMIDLYKLYKFFKEQWLGSILIIVWIISVFIYQHKRNELLNKAYILETKIKELEKKAKVELKSVDSLKTIDTIIVTRIKIIKQKEYEEIRVIDSLPISGLQSYFTERYPK
jgi:hypothetical protein